MQLNLILDYIEYSAEIKMANSIITNGLLFTEERLDELIAHGLDSITVSRDTLKGNYFDKAAELKGKASKKLLMLCLDRNLRDLEVSMAISKDNIEEIPEMVRQNTSVGIWTSFDPLHWSKGQPESKCPPFKDVESAIVKPGDEEVIRNVMTELLDMKKAGYLIHPSRKVLEMWMQPENIFKHNWKCFTSWLTIEADGTVYGCDDYQPPEFKGRYNITDFDLETFKDFREEWNFAIKKCPGCFWSTHVMSCEMLKEPTGGNYFRHEVTGC